MFTLIYAIRYLCAGTPGRRIEVLKWTGKVNVILGFVFMAIFAVLVLISVTDAIVGG